MSLEWGRWRALFPKRHVIFFTLSLKNLFRGNKKFNDVGEIMTNLPSIRRISLLFFLKFFFFPLLGMEKNKIY